MINVLVFHAASWRVSRAGLWVPQELSATLPQYHVSGIRLDADPVIDGRSNPLLAAQVAFGSLNRDVPEQKLNLLQLTSRGVAQPSAGPAKIVRLDLGDAKLFRCLFYDVPH